MGDCCSSDDTMPLMQSSSNTERKQLASSILTEKELNTLLSMLSRQDSIFRKKTWNLIFRKTGDELNRKLFIQQVHTNEYSEKSNIIVIIETEKDNVCGGYTSKNWKEQNKIRKRKDLF